MATDAAKSLQNPAALIAEANEDQILIAERRAIVAAQDRKSAFEQAKQCGVTFEEFVGNTSYWAAKLADQGF